MRAPWSRSKDLEELLDDVRRYGSKHSELRAAHHFLFSLPHPCSLNTTQVDFLVMGINPGETAACRAIAKGEGNEESFLEDYQQRGSDYTPGRRRWFARVQRILPGAACVFSELFFWSTPSTSDLKKRYGPLHKNKHLDFCRDANLRLLDLLRPRVVVFPGLTAIPVVVNKYSLSVMRNPPIRCKRTSHRLVEHFADGAGRDWIFTKHWSGGRGFSREQEEVIKDYILKNT